MSTDPRLGDGIRMVEQAIANKSRSRCAPAEAVSGPILGTHIQVIVNGCVQFDQDVEQIEFTSILYTSADDGPPCGMQFSARYGHRRPDGTIET
jgi:hypothetical protein